MRADDAFWAARRVMAFTDDLIRAMVKTGQFSDPAAEQHLADVLIKRRDAIGRAYLATVNPVIDPVLSAAGVLTFGNAALERGLAAAPEFVRGRLGHVRQRHWHVQPNRRNRWPRSPRGALRTAERAGLGT